MKTKVSEMKTHIMTGNTAAAYAAKYARVQVIAAYPITPQTTIVEAIADLIDEGEMEAEYIRVESEHSAMAACIGAAATGARAFTATSSHGLALMHEMLHWASGSRLPIVMANVNRAMGPPWNIWPDHNDSISQRDVGWIQFYVESNQEVFDTILQCHRICENREVLLPAMVNLDGFIISHTSAPVSIPSQEEVDRFIPDYAPNPATQLIMDPDKPATHGNIIMVNSPDDWYYEYRYMIHEAMMNAKTVIREIEEEFHKRFGRSHGALVDEYKCEDANLLLVSMGTIASQAKVAIDELRQEGYKVGALKLRVFRPFPKEDFQRLAKRVEVFAVIDRNISFGMGGAASAEIKTALYNHKKHPLVLENIAGIGGRDVRSSDIKKMVLGAVEAAETGEIGKEINWHGLRVGEMK
ncbi:MAG: transketolase C-terminal domain-containing protein [Promethearchaeota archaeon]